MKASSEFALYHQAQREPVRLEILKTHDDGTVDLGRDGVVIVSQCQVVREPQVGSCTPEARAKAPKAPQQPQPESEAAASAPAAAGSASAPASSDQAPRDPEAPVGARPPVK